MFQERYNRIIIPFNFLLDMVLLLTLYFLFLSQNQILFYLIVSIIWSFSSLYSGSYRVSRTYSGFTAIRPMLFCLGLFTLIYILIIFLGLLPLENSNIQLYFLGSGAILLLLITLARYLFFYHYRRRGKNTRYSVLLSQDISNERIKKLNRDAINLGYRFIKNISTSETYLHQLQNLMESRKIDFVFIQEKNKTIIEEVNNFCDYNGIRMKIFLPLSPATGRRGGLDQLGGFPVIDIRHEPLLYLGNRFLKRSLDIVTAILSILFVLTWLPFVVKLAQLITYPGPLFFIQERIGRDGKIFNLYKFRTMFYSMEIDSARKGQSEKTVESDTRIPWFGSFLRRTNLDEYPQFLNVLFGSMSTVGPRPHMVGEDNILEGIVPRYRMRRFVNPGITGLAAIKGYRGGTDNIELMTKRTEYDIWYLENWTFWLDIKIMVITIGQMLTFRIPRAY